MAEFCVCVHKRIKSLPSEYFCKYFWTEKTLRAITCKYGESNDRRENSDFLLLRQKDPFVELFSEIYFQIKAPASS